MAVVALPQLGKGVLLFVVAGQYPSLYSNTPEIETLTEQLEKLKHFGALLDAQHDVLDLPCEQVNSGQRFSLVPPAYSL